MIFITVGTIAAIVAAVCFGIEGAKESFKLVKNKKSKKTVEQEATEYKEVVDEIIKDETEKAEEAK